MPKTGHETPDQLRADEKRAAAQARADAAARESAEQEWPSDAPAQRTAPPKGRRGQKLDES